MTDAAATPEVVQADHDMIVRLWERAETNAKRIAELIEWKHSQLPPVVFSMQKDILTLSKDTSVLRGEVAALCATVDKLASTVTLLVPVIRQQDDLAGRQETHEHDCLELGRANLRHQEGFEARVNALFAASDASRDKVRDRIDSTRTWVITIGASTLLTVLTGTVAVIWAVIQRGGLSLFHS